MTPTERFLKHQGLVKRVMKRFTFGRWDDDLIGEGRIGLWEACNAPITERFVLDAYNKIWERMRNWYVAQRFPKRVINMGLTSLDEQIGDSKETWLDQIPSSVNVEDQAEYDEYIELASRHPVLRLALEGRSVSETGRQLGMTERAVWWYKHKAVNQILAGKVPELPPLRKMKRFQVAD